MELDDDGGVRAWLRRVVEFAARVSAIGTRAPPLAPSCTLPAQPITASSTGMARWTTVGGPAYYDTLDLLLGCQSRRVGDTRSGRNLPQEQGFVRAARKYDRLPRVHVYGVDRALVTPDLVSVLYMRTIAWRYSRELVQDLCTPRVPDHHRPVSTAGHDPGPVPVPACIQ